MIKVETAHGLGNGGRELGRSEGGVGTKSGGLSADERKLVEIVS